MATVKRSKW